MSPERRLRLGDAITCSSLNGEMSDKSCRISRRRTAGPDYRHQLRDRLNRLTRAVLGVRDYSNDPEWRRPANEPPQARSANRETPSIWCIPARCRRERLGDPCCVVTAARSKSSNWSNTSRPRISGCGRLIITLSNERTGSCRGADVELSSAKPNVRKPGRLVVEQGGARNRVKGAHQAGIVVGLGPLDIGGIRIRRFSRSSRLTHLTSG